MIDINKKYTTRDGREVRIYATDGAGSWPVHGAVLFESGWCDASWSKTGSATQCQFDDFDLIEVKEKRVMWVNVYEDGNGAAHADKEDADGCSVPGRIARIHVEYCEGQFDD